MSAPVNVTMGGAALEALQRVSDPAGALQSAARAMDAENQLTVSRIQSAYLSFPSNGPTVSIGCRVISSRLRGSMRATVATVQGDTITASIGSNVKYAAVQEFGADFTRTTKPGRVRLRTDAAGNLLRQVNGKLAVFAKKSHARFRSVAFAGGKSYSVHIEGRHFTRRGIEERLPQTGAAMSTAIVQFWRGGAA